MELEIHQLDLRYSRLRARVPKRERALVASIAEVGQLVPVAVVGNACGDSASHVVVDGFKRIRACRQLKHDVVRVVRLDLTEVEALLLHHSARAGEGESILEQAWLLEELRHRFDVTMEELARRFERTPSWVSRRLALVRELPEVVQREIRDGRIVPHAAAKFLVPVARANPTHCERMACAIAQHGLSTRDVGELYAGWRDGTHAARERILTEPLLFLRTRKALRDVPDDALGPREGLLRDVGVLGAVARRARSRVLAGAAAELSPLDYDRILGGLRATSGEVQALVDLLQESQGASHARPEHAVHDPGAEEAGSVAPANQSAARDLARSGVPCGRGGLG